MDRIITLSFFGIIAMMLFCVFAVTLDNVGRYQIDAVFACSIQFTEEEHQARCRNELDGFGHLVILGAKT